MKFPLASEQEALRWSSAFHSRTASEVLLPGCVSLSPGIHADSSHQMNLNPLSIPTGFLPGSFEGRGRGGGDLGAELLGEGSFCPGKASGFPLAREEIRSFPQNLKKKKKSKLIIIIKGTYFSVG